MKKTFSAVNESAPLWMQHTIAAITILLASKGVLIDGIPGIEDAMKQLLGAWFDYVANWIAIAFAIAMVFSRKKDVI